MRQDTVCVPNPTSSLTPSRRTPRHGMPHSDGGRGDLYWWNREIVPNYAVNSATYNRENSVLHMLDTPVCTYDTHGQIAIDDDNGDIGIVRNFSFLQRIVVLPTIPPPPKKVDRDRVPFLIDGRLFQLPLNLSTHHFPKVCKTSLFPFLSALHEN